MLKQAKQASAEAKLVMSQQLEYSFDQEPGDLVATVIDNISKANLAYDSNSLLMELNSQISIARETASFANLSEHVYGTSDVQIDGDWQEASRYLMGVGKVTVEKYDFYSGFHAKTYINHWTKTVAIVFEGTKPPLSSPIGTALDLADYNQYEKASEYTKNIINEFKDTDYKIVATGHSLGGALAAWVAAESNLKAYSFNAKAIDQDIIDNIEQNNLDLSGITSVRVRGEKLGNLVHIGDQSLEGLLSKGNAGNIYTVYTPGVVKGLYKHGMKALAEDLSTLRKMDFVEPQQSQNTNFLPTN